MTASAVATPPRPASLLTRIAGAVRARTAEALVFGGAAAVALLHAFDDAFLLPGGGVPLTQHALAFGIALVATVLAVARFDSLRPGVRSAIAFTFGVLAAVNGGRHVHHFAIEGQPLTANDVTGALALAAAVVLVGLAAWIPFRHRGEGASGPVRRWAIRVLVLPVFLLAVVLLLRPGRHGDRRHPLAAPPDRQPAERRLPERQLHRLRRRRPRGLVPARRRTARPCS